MSGYIEVEAPSADEATELAEELMDAHGVEALFGYEPLVAKYGIDPKQVLYSKHTHGMREVLDCEEVAQ